MSAVGKVRRILHDCGVPLGSPGDEVYVTVARAPKRRGAVLLEARYAVRHPDTAALRYQAVRRLSEAATALRLQGWRYPVYTDTQVIVTRGLQTRVDGWPFPVRALLGVTATAFAVLALVVATVICGAIGDALRSAPAHADPGGTPVDSGFVRSFCDHGNRLYWAPGYSEVLAVASQDPTCVTRG